jgi:hypothetical protein
MPLDLIGTLPLPALGFGRPLHALKSTLAKKRLKNLNL